MHASNITNAIAELPTIINKTVGNYDITKPSSQVVVYHSPLIDLILAPLYAFYTVALVLSLLTLALFIAYARSALANFNAGGLCSREEWPKVSVIVPIKGESLDVVLDAVDRISSVDYPRDKLEAIFVSDDDPESFNRIREAVSARSREKGLNVLMLRREEPIGFKGGALNYAVRHSSGEYIVVFDVDSKFEPDAIRLLVCNADAEHVSFLGWTGYRKLRTKLGEALEFFYRVLLSRIAIFGKFMRGGVVMLLGSGFAIRRDLLDKVGGFCHCVADDYELSARLLSMGYRIRYVPVKPIEVEIPCVYSIFRRQYARWVFNSIWVLRKYFRELLKSSLSLKAKLDVILSLVQNSLISVTALTILINLALSVVGVVLPPPPILILQLAVLVGVFTLGFYVFKVARAEGYNVVDILKYFGRAGALSVPLSFTALLSAARGLISEEITWNPTPKGKGQLHSNDIPLFELFLVVVLAALALTALLVYPILWGQVNVPLLVNTTTTLLIILYCLKLSK